MLLSCSGKCKYATTIVNTAPEPTSAGKKKVEEGVSERGVKSDSSAATPAAQLLYSPFLRLNKDSAPHAHGSVEHCDYRRPQEQQEHGCLP